MRDIVEVEDREPTAVKLSEIMEAVYGEGEEFILLRSIKGFGPALLIDRSEATRLRTLLDQLLVP